MTADKQEKVFDLVDKSSKCKPARLTLKTIRMPKWLFPLAAAGAITDNQIGYTLDKKTKVIDEAAFKLPFDVKVRIEILHNTNLI